MEPRDYFMPYSGPERRNHNKATAGAKRFLSLLVCIGWTIPLVILVIAYFEKPPLSFTNEPFPYDVSKSYTEGGEITFQLEYCASKGMDYQVTRRFRSIETGQEYFISSGSVTIQDGCHSVVGQPTKLPQKIEPGNYEMIYSVVAPGIVRPHRFEAKSAVVPVYKR